MHLSLLDEIIAKLDVMPPESLDAIRAAYAKAAPLWVANVGGQMIAADSLADEMFFGGQPGGGKSALLIGLAITQHTNSIVFRREFPQVKGLEDEAERILGSRNGYNASTHIWRIPGTVRTLEFGSVPHENDKRKYQGRAHDLKGFDEITAFTRSQYRYLTLWLRSAVPGQRCRVIATGNPPDSPEGLWVIQHWAPWLDETYHDPALPGELRWAVPKADDSDDDLFFRTVEEAIGHLETLANPPRDQDGKIIPPRSRTFIPGKLDENPDLMRSGYSAVLAGASKDMRKLASGKFESILEDHPMQVIPTAWIMAAQKRWVSTPPKGVPMVAMGVDVAQGGADQTCLAWRHDWWYAPLVTVPGTSTPNPSDTAALVVKYRRDAAAIVVDCGGGYGGGVVEFLEQNEIACLRYKGSNTAAGRTKDRSHAFANKRAETWWRFREALDPDQIGGSPIALPDDPAIRSDLASTRYETTARGILLEDKDEIKKRLGRSPDKADAIVMSWSEGSNALRRHLSGPGSTRRGDHSTRPAFANVGYSNLKRRR